MSEQCFRVGITRRTYLFLSQFLHGQIFGIFLGAPPYSETCPVDTGMDGAKNWWEDECSWPATENNTCFKDLESEKSDGFNQDFACRIFWT